MDAARAESPGSTLQWPLHPALLFALLFSALFVLHAPLLRLPYFWDEAGHYIPAAHDLYLSGDLIPRDTLSNAHPPLVMAYLAAWWKLSGYAPAVTRTAMLLIAAFGLLGLFRLALAVSNRAVAAATVVCTALYPVFFAQSSLAHVDLAAAAFTLWGLSYYFQDADDGPREGGRPRSRPMISDRWMAAIMFSLAALSKETAIVTPLILFAWKLIPARWWGHAEEPAAAGEQHRSILLARAGPLLLPLLPLALWFAYHYARTGYVFGNPEFVRYNVTATLHPLRFLLAFVQRLWQVLGHMNLFVLTLATAAAMALPPIAGRQRIAVRTQLIFAALLLAHVAAFSLIGGAVLARYLLPVVPLVVLVCVSTLWRRVRAWPLAVAAICATFVAGLFINPPYRFSPEDNLAYRDYILLHQKAAGYLAAHYPDTRVLTAWPASDELTKPYLGYVPRPVPVLRLENFSLDQIMAAQHATAPYGVALLFSTKYEPPRTLLPRFRFWESAQTRFFDYHRDLPPEATARMLGGRIVWQESRGGQWIAILDMNRPRNAGRSSPGLAQLDAVRSRSPGIHP